jgi:hypothetical protein
VHSLSGIRFVTFRLILNALKPSNHIIVPLSMCLSLSRMINQNPPKCSCPDQPIGVGLHLFEPSDILMPFHAICSCYKPRLVTSSSWIVRNDTLTLQRGVVQISGQWSLCWQLTIINYVFITLLTHGIPTPTLPTPTSDTHLLDLPTCS